MSAGVHICLTAGTRRTAAALRALRRNTLTMRNRWFMDSDVPIAASSLSAGPDRARSRMRPDEAGATIATADMKTCLLVFMSA
jgi:hypothetical protein